MNRTLQDIKNWTSLNNLKKGKPLGQIATLLILIITALLIFVLIVANLGQISSYATRLSNAADAASLYLASQLGTKAYQISESLAKACGNRERCCRKTGLLAIMLAIAFVLIALIITWFTWGFGSPLLVMAIAMLAGAAGGAIGGAISGTGAAQGAIQGAAIGAAIGGGVVAGAAAAGTTVGAGGATSGAGAAGAGGATVEAGAGAASVSGGMMSVPAGAAVPAGTSVLAGSVVVPSLAGAIAGATLAIASSIYNAYVTDTMTGDAMAEAAKAISGLPEYSRYRESVFLQALSQTIDDPNKVVDDVDSDGDGDTTELVPNFQVCWDKRITWLKQNNGADIAGANNAINNFFNGPVAKFQQAINTFKTHLARKEADVSLCEGEYGVINNCFIDGKVVELLRALNDNGYESFWKPGPTLSELTAWKSSWDPLQCPSCEPPNPPIDKGYDELDYVIDELGDFGADINEIRSQGADALVYNWRHWVTLLYDPGTADSEPSSTPGGYYYLFYNLINGDNSSNPPRLGIKSWIDEIESIRGKLPGCITSSSPCEGTYGTMNECITISNPPCQGLSSNPNFGTIDTDFDDEFQGAKQAINDFIPHIEEFRQACRDFYETMVSLMEPIERNIPPMACGLSGINPVTYNWKDSRGNHSITVRVSRFEIPDTVTRKYGNWLVGKKCIELRYAGQNVTVNIERHDPARVGIGVLGAWNPFGGGIIRRRSTSQYISTINHGYVKIVGR